MKLYMYRYSTCEVLTAVARLCHRCTGVGPPTRRRPPQNHTIFIFHLTICSRRHIGAIETIARGLLPIPYDRPPAEKYLEWQAHLNRKRPFFLITFR
jgi:hypothetical protein